VKTTVIAAAATAIAWSVVRQFPTTSAAVTMPGAATAASWLATPCCPSARPGASGNSSLMSGFAAMK